MKDGTPLQIAASSYPLSKSLSNMEAGGACKACVSSSKIGVIDKSSVTTSKSLVMTAATAEWNISLTAFLALNKAVSLWEPELRFINPLIFRFGCEHGLDIDDPIVRAKLMNKAWLQSNCFNPEVALLMLERGSWEVLDYSDLTRISLTRWWHKFF